MHKQQSLMAAGSCANAWSEEFATVQSQKIQILMLRLVEVHSFRHFYM